MNWFKKKGEIVDLTYLAKRGLLKVPEQKEEYKDLSSPGSSSDSGFGFLAGIASSAESSPSISKGVSNTNNNKLDDFEYKLDAISKRVNMILDRLDLVEKKVARDLRNGSLT